MSCSNGARILSSGGRYIPMSINSLVTLTLPQLQSFNLEPISTLETFRSYPNPTKANNNVILQTYISATSAV